MEKVKNKGKDFMYFTLVILTLEIIVDYVYPFTKLMINKLFL